MLVIEGYTGKSLEVGKYLEELESDKVLIITNEIKAFNFLHDNDFIPVIFIHELYSFDNTEEVVAILKLNEKNELQEPLEHVIFYVNTNKDNIEKYKELEEKFGLKTVLTVQSHASEDGKIKKYNI